MQYMMRIFNDVIVSKYLAESKMQDINSKYPKVKNE